MRGLLTSIHYFAVKNCAPGDTNPDCKTNLPMIKADAATIKPVLQIFFGAIAVLTVIFIIIAAIRFSTALGDPGGNGRPSAMAKLRNSIIWASIGLVIVLLAEAIVTFVIGRV